MFSVFSTNYMPNKPSQPILTFITKTPPYSELCNLNSFFFFKTVAVTYLDHIQARAEGSPSTNTDPYKVLLIFGQCHTPRSDCHTPAIRKVNFWLIYVDHGWVSLC